MAIKSDEQKSYDGLDVDAAVARLRGSSVPAAAAPDANATRMMEAETPIAPASPPSGTGTTRRRITPKQAEREREEAVLERVLASAGAEVPADAPIATKPSAPTVTATTDGSDAARDEPGNELAVWAGITAIDNPEFRWRKLAMFVRSGGSTLGRWLALLQLQVIWGDRELAVRVGYIPRARGGLSASEAMAPTNEIPNLGILFRAIHSDIGVPKSTAYREIQYARALLDRFGPATVFGMLGRPIANDDRFLRDLARLEHEARGRDALRIYVEGAGEMKAKEALKSYLGAQGERRRLASAPDAVLPPASGEPDVVTADAGMHQGAAPESAPRKGVSLNGGSALRQTDQSTEQAGAPTCAAEHEQQGPHIPGTAGCAAPEPVVGPSAQQVSVAPASLPRPAGREVLRMARDGTPTMWNGWSFRVVEQTDAEIVIEPFDGPDREPPPEPPPAPPPLRSSDSAAPVSSPARTASFAFGGPPLKPIPSSATRVVRFAACAADIAKAVKAASIVEPQGVTPDGQSGYLFMVDVDPAGGACGHVMTHSYNAFCKVAFAVRSVGRAGWFAYPAAHVHGFQFLHGEELAVTAYMLADDRHIIDYVSTHGAALEKPHDLDPRLFVDPSNDSKATRAGVNAPALQAALEASVPFLGRASSDADSQVIQLVSARSNGQLFAADTNGAIVFECDAFRDRDLIIHRDSVKGLLGFLSRASGTIEVGSGAKWSFAVASGQTFGWARHERALSLYRDDAVATGLVVSVATAEVLELLRGTRTQLVRKRGTIQVSYSSATAQLRFVVTSAGKSTMSMKVRERPGRPNDADYSREVDIVSFMRLFTLARSEEVELHVGDFKTACPQTMLQSVERFEIDGHACRVTRSCSCVS